VKNVVNAVNILYGALHKWHMMQCITHIIPILYAMHIIPAYYE